MFMHLKRYSVVVSLRVTIISKTTYLFLDGGDNLHVIMSDINTSKDYLWKSKSLIYYKFNYYTIVLTIIDTNLFKHNIYLSHRNVAINLH